MPGFDAKRAAANPFHPRFVRTLLDFGVLRFMAWQEANTDQLPRNWAERAKTSDRYAVVGEGCSLLKLMAWQKTKTCWSHQLLRACAKRANTSDMRGLTSAIPQDKLVGLDTQAQLAGGWQWLV